MSGLNRQFGELVYLWVPRVQIPPPPPEPVLGGGLAVPYICNPLQQSQRASIGNRKWSRSQVALVLKAEPFATYDYKPRQARKGAAVSGPLWVLKDYLA